MSRSRVLYLDVPFEHETGGDKNRSRFLWSALTSAFDTDWGRILPANKPLPPETETGIRPVVTLLSARNPWWESDSVFQFPNAELEKFRHLLTQRNYAAVVARFHAPWHLARIASEHPTRPAVVVDLDMLSSRLVGLTWQQAPSLRNRWFLMERLKLERCERALMRRPFLVLLSNPEELADVRRRGVPREPPCRLEVLPNVMPDPGHVSADTAFPRRSGILFFGSLNSAANTDAFRHLADDLLPGLAPTLRRLGARIEVVGRNPPAWFADHLRGPNGDLVSLVGGVPSMDLAIRNSRFVLLPLRVASGTRTRILEAAAAGRAVVTTPIGAEGIDVGDDACIADTTDGLVAAAVRCLEHPAETDALGLRLRHRCLARYSSDRVGGDFTQLLASWIGDCKGRTPEP
ncbi:MAG: glycosyltransferase [Verrucomicrobiota bacterium]